MCVAESRANRRRNWIKIEAVPPLHARLPRQMALDHVEELEMLLLANRLNKKIQTPRLKLYVVLSIFNTHIFLIMQLNMLYAYKGILGRETTNMFIG